MALSEEEVTKLQEENAALKAECERMEEERAHEKHVLVPLSVQAGSGHHTSPHEPEPATAAAQRHQSSSKAEHLGIVVVGASGDLAVKKTYPALFSLFSQSLLTNNLHIIGYARSEMEHQKFLSKISSKFPKTADAATVKSFLSICSYITGQYDSDEDFKKVDAALVQLEQHSDSSNSNSNSSSHSVGHVTANRIFYFAVPPTVFVAVSTALHNTCVTAASSTGGYTKIIVEKPFGKDLESSNELIAAIGAVWQEQQIYRIDHYLGKEMVQNLITLRFANRVFEPLWNSDHVACVLITFKEDFGTLGRGGYFDSFGIIRDVMQNHLLQMLSLVAMEDPVSLDAEDIRNEKVKLLQAVEPITRENLVVGQYGPDRRSGSSSSSSDGSREVKYRDDPSVPDDSVTATFACARLTVNTPRWKGTPFILKCGKALDSRKAEIRVQFKLPANTLFSSVSSPNELVLRVQPDECVYMKLTTKQPGLNTGVRHTELDLSYKKRFTEAQQLPDAYERLIYDVVKGDHNLFVRADELEAAWKIFTPVLHELDAAAVRPEEYEYGGRGPAAADAMIKAAGYIRTTRYEWDSKPSNTPYSTSVQAPRLPAMSPVSVGRSQASALASPSTR